MLTLWKWPVFGIQLLLFLYTCESFVLLTANIEDVKKLANKFVSESLADKIATFIANAAQHVITTSEEVQRDVSEENSHYNINTQQQSSNEFRTDNQKRPKRMHAKNKKKNLHFLQDKGQLLRKQNTNNGNLQVMRTDSIENNDVDFTPNNTFNAVLDLNIKPEENQRADEVTDQKTDHHRHHEYKLLATSGNVFLTTVISSRESNENHKNTKKSN